MGKISELKLLDGTSMPWLAFGSGTGQAMSGFQESAGRMALEAGLTHIDTAQAYGDDAQEEQVGQLLKACGIPREKLYVTSKLSETKNYSVPVPMDEIESRIRSSIEKLGGPPNLWLLHNPFVVGKAQADSEEIQACWKVFEKLKDEGVLQSIGVSNFRPQDFQAIFKMCKHKPVCNQIEFHPYLLDQLKPVLEVHDANNILTVSYGPMQPAIRGIHGPLEPVIEKIAARITEDLGRPFDRALILLKWCKARGVAAVTTSSKKERIQAYAELDSLPDLKPEEVEQIDKAGQGSHYRYYNQHMVKELPVPEGVNHLEGPTLF